MGFLILRNQNLKMSGSIQPNGMGPIYVQEAIPVSELLSVELFSMISVKEREKRKLTEFPKISELFKDSSSLLNDVFKPN